MSHALVICTANVCRSPIAAALLSGVLGPTVPVLSAGSRANPRIARCPAAGAWLRDHVGAGAELPPEVVTTATEGTPTVLDADLVRGAGLILTAGRVHRSAVVRLVPRAQQVTFTIRQAARLAQWHLDPASPVSSPRANGGSLTDPLRFLVDELDAARGLANRPAAIEEDDILDPHEDEGAMHSVALEQVAESIAVLGNLLRDVSGVGRW
jgi:protein-tyrosine phosphatase